MCLSILHSLAGVNLTDESCETLASILQSGNSHLVELDLSFNSLGDLGVKLLCASLSNPQNKLEKLTLSHNELEYIGVKLLCDCLTSPHCKLQTLGFVIISLMFAIMVTQCFKAYANSCLWVIYHMMNLGSDYRAIIIVLYSIYISFLQIGWHKLLRTVL